MFEQATRNKFRFPYKGSCDVEDLWDLSVEDLDGVYKKLNRTLKTTKEDSLLGPKTKESERETAMVNIVKHIVTVKLRESEEYRHEAARSVKKQKILEIIGRKQDNSLEEKSEEDLVAMLNEL